MVTHPRTTADLVTRPRVTANPAPARMLGAGSLLLVAALAGAPAVAAPGVDPSGATGTSGSVSRSDGTCTMYANRRTFGFDCTTGTGDVLSIREVLGSDKLPRCWHEELPESLAAEYTDRARTVRAGEAGRYVLETCLSGINPVTLTGTARFSHVIVWLPAGTPPTRLTANQRRLVNHQGACGRLEIALVAEPTELPRVAQDVAFRVQPLDGLCSGGDLSRRDTNSDIVGPLFPGDVGLARTGGITGMRARVRPFPGTSCGWVQGLGPEITDQTTPVNTLGACWVRFPRSSATQEGGEYRMAVTVQWSIETQAPGGGWPRWELVEREYTQVQRVSEIQTLVVP
jgi:hypothetical protein